MSVRSHSVVFVRYREMLSVLAGKLRVVDVSGAPIRTRAVGVAEIVLPSEFPGTQQLSRLLSVAYGTAHFERAQRVPSTRALQSVPNFFTVCHVRGFFPLTVLNSRRHE